MLVHSELQLGKSYAEDTSLMDPFPELEHRWFAIVQSKPPLYDSNPFQTRFPDGVIAEDCIVEQVVFQAENDTDLQGMSAVQQM